MLNNLKLIKKHGFQATRYDFWDRSAFSFMKLNQVRPEIYNSSAGTRATTRETRVARLAR